MRTHSNYFFLIFRNNHSFIKIIFALLHPGLMATGPDLKLCHANIFSEIDEFVKIEYQARFRTKQTEDLLHICFSKTIS